MALGKTGTYEENGPVPVVANQATRPGLEPGMRESKSLVLPLHHRVEVGARYWSLVVSVVVAYLTYD
jgi:hypothetical protein